MAVASHVDNPRTTPKKAFISQNQQAFNFVSLPRSPASNSTDPFDALPISDAGNSQLLVYHYQTVVTENDCIINPRKAWVPFAMQDPALLHATLVFSAWQLTTLHGNPSPLEVAFHTGESIRWVNKSLLKPNHVPTDLTIAVVACFVIFENLAANVSGVKLHMDGLEALVKSRGGITTIADPIPRRVVTWADSEAAIITETPPRFKLPSHENEEHPEDWGRHSSLAMLYEAKLFHLTGLQDLSKEITQIYWGIHNLTAMKEAVSHLTKKVEISSWSSMVERLERRTITILQSSMLKSNRSKYAIFTLFARAAILHIYIVLRDFIPRALPFYVILSDRFRASIEAVDILCLHREYPEMIVWILLMGGMASYNTPNRSWFVDRFAGFCGEVGLRGENAVSDAVKELLWTELYRSPVTAGFWNDVARAQGVEVA